MHNALQKNRSIGTAVVVGMAAAAHAGHADWPILPRPIIAIDQKASSFSAVRILPAAAVDIFAQSVSDIYRELASRQEPLGAEFEAVWDANASILYES